MKTNKMIKRATFLVWFLACNILGVYGQNTYTLEQCIRMSMNNNTQNKNARLNIDISKQGSKEAFTHYFPVAELEGFGFKADKSILSMNLGTALPPIALLQNGMTGAVIIRQPIFMGGKISLENKLAKLGVTGNEEYARISQNEVILTISKLYWDLMYLYEQRNTLSALHEQLEKLHSYVEVSYKSGLLNRNDLLKINIKLNDLKSQKLRLENGINLLKMTLCQKIGIGYSDSLNVIFPSVELDQLPIPETIYVNHEMAVSNRAEKKMADDNIESKQLLIKMERAECLPNVAIGGIFYSQNMIADKWENNSSVFVSVRIPITGWWGGRHAILKKKMEKQIALNNSIDLQEQLLLQMQQNRNELDEAYQQTLITQENLAQSAENLRINDNEYKAGTIGINDLLDAQSSLQQSKDKHIKAFTEYKYKQTEYKIATGQEIISNL